MTEYKKIFIDTAPLIYLLEEEKTFYPKVNAFFDKYAESSLYTSPVTVMEYLTVPYRDNDRDVINSFHHFLLESEIEIIPISNKIAEEAAKIRASYRSFKAMDALQLATACFYGCDLFLTNDKQLKQFDKASVLTVSEM